MWNQGCLRRSFARSGPLSRSPVGIETRVLSVSKYSAETGKNLPGVLPRYPLGPEADRNFRVVASAESLTVSKTRNELVEKHPWHAVEIVAPKSACPAAQALKGRRFLSTEAPLLPLHDCALTGSCHCVYRKHTDRRDSTVRRSEDDTGIRRVTPAAARATLPARPSQNRLTSGCAAHASILNDHLHVRALPRWYAGQGSESASVRCADIGYRQPRRATGRDQCNPRVLRGPNPPPPRSHRSTASTEPGAPIGELVARAAQVDREPVIWSQEAFNPIQYSSNRCTLWCEAKLLVLGSDNRRWRCQIPMTGGGRLLRYTKPNETPIF